VGVEDDAAKPDEWLHVYTRTDPLCCAYRAGELTVDEFVMWSYCNAYRYGLGVPERYRVTVPLAGWHQHASVAPASVLLAMVSPAHHGIVRNIQNSLQ
jgi:hypothetical protein